MFDFEFIRENWLFIATGIGETLGVTIASFILTIPLAILVARGRRSTLLPIQALSAFYVWLTDGIPLLLQIFFIFLALPQLGIFLPGFGSAILVMAINYGSRMSEIFLARLPDTEESQGRTRISLIPLLTRELTSMIKDSTLISMTGFLHDVMWRATRVGRAEFKNLEAFIIAGIIYLILITSISLSTKILDHRMATAESSTTGSI